MFRIDLLTGINVDVISNVMSFVNIHTTSISNSNQVYIKQYGNILSPTLTENPSVLYLFFNFIVLKSRI